MVLPDDAAHHVRKVLRVSVSDTVEVFNGKVAHYAAFSTISKSRVEVEIGECCATLESPKLAITVIQSISRGERMDFSLQKAVELGAAGIVPVVSERTVVRLDRQRQEKRMAHWRGIIQHASEQCGRIDLPELGSIRTLNEWLVRDRNTPCWLLHPTAAESLAAQSPPGAALSLLAGPEGGFSDEEIRSIEGHGIKPVNLGPRILRTESAAIAALAVAQALWGDLG